MHFPFLNQIQLQPEPINEDDELAQAINDDPIVHDNNWQLTEYPDGEAIEHFWQEVAEDIHKDPDWYDFTE